MFRCLALAGGAKMKKKRMPCAAEEAEERPSLAVGPVLEAGTAGHCMPMRSDLPEALTEGTHMQGGFA